ncbi:uncharacterized protein THITE_110755 [Thermothielavioides terrestris NRRL 8126]|uniref:Nucleotidyl transferase AbiEii/AbiGii toxin family protein n=1 Tax=Thermothielavioides terrestris (strain ATCC 38088 / NRRL 8126) TaxID=578455 RepID=G2QZ82_THETT|nr:uncharacterized protein THITE_110755 [Thermothielavioides terrestris NRRL 8126]AEO66318.1 hypothetical protein THITE_110755 [Thermothielavioides terrestris NRRL 8126]
MVGARTTLIQALRGQVAAPPPANTYTPQSRDSLQAASTHASEHHLVFAMDYIVEKLRAHGVPYALMGGFSLRLRGNPRQTVDVDLAVGGNMLQLRTALAGDPRVMRVYVHVGGPLHAGLDEVPVCVDLITEAFLGAPVNTLEASEEVEGVTKEGTRTYRLIDIQHILASKLAAFCARGDLDSHDFLDLMWLLIKSPYSVKLREGSVNVPLDQRQAFLAAASSINPKLPTAFIQRIKLLLRLA